MGVTNSETNGSPVPNGEAPVAEQESRVHNGEVPAAEQESRVLNGDAGEVEDGPAKKGADPAVATLEIEGGEGEDDGSKETLDGLLRRFVSGVLQHQGDKPITWRIRASYGAAAPRIREASRNTVADVLEWMRAGSPFRTLLVTAIGTVVLLALTGLMVFMVFFLVATMNAVILSLLMSLAAAGGMLAIFFASLAFVYVGAVAAAVFVISAITISAIIAVFVVAGWVGFFWIMWTAARKSVDLTKQSLGISGSAIQAYSASRNTHHED